MTKKECNTDQILPQVVAACLSVFTRLDSLL